MKNLISKKNLVLPYLKFFIKKIYTSLCSYYNQLPLFNFSQNKRETWKKNLILW